jgi:hypothetical protein
MSLKHHVNIVGTIMGMWKQNMETFSVIFLLRKIMHNPLQLEDYET